jgi:hypothetical protein
LGNYFGGIGSTINPSLHNSYGRSIRASGGWIQVSLTPIKDFAFNFGVGVDKPKKSDVQANSSATAITSGRTGALVAGLEKNLTVYGNVIYSFTPQFTTGLELIRYKTWQKDASTTHKHKSATGIMFAATYNF